MFLKFMNTNEKELFLELANYLIRVDDEVANEEIEMLDGFRLEMDMPNDFYEIKNLNKDILLHAFSTIEKVNKKKIIIELLGLALSDNNYDIKEMEFLADLANIAQVRENEINELKDLIFSLNKIYQKFGIFISE